MAEPTLYIPGPTQGIQAPTQGIPALTQGIPASTHSGIHHAPYTPQQLSSIPHQPYVIPHNAQIIPAPTPIMQDPHDLPHQRVHGPTSNYSQTDPQRFNRGEYTITSYPRIDAQH
ncbi:unnamed protein product, partial [Lymnaea stagnalis]